MLSYDVNVYLSNNLIKSTNNIEDINDRLIYALLSEDLYEFYFSVYIPICYRLGNVSLGLKFADKGFKFMNPKQHSYYNEILSSIDVSLYDDAISKILDVFSQYNVPILHTSTRIKGAYSIFVKYINKKHKNIYDLYGLELIIDEDVFFSTYYIEILRNLSKLSYVQSINDLSVVSGLYRNLPCTILKLKVGTYFMQLKIRPIGYKYSEYGTVYFVYKGYNLDKMALSNESEISRILKLSQLEKTSKSLYEVMYLELKNFEYLQDVTDNSIDYISYVKRLESFRKRIVRVCSNSI